MIETGKPFKMKPKTRKAEDALWLASDLLGIHIEEVMWENRSDIGGRHLSHTLIAAVGDTGLQTLRWVVTVGSPDWEIVK